MFNLLKNTALCCLLLCLATVWPNTASAKEPHADESFNCQLPPPTSVVPLMVTSTSIKIQWSLVTNAVKYRIRYRDLSVPASPYLTVYRTHPTDFFQASGLISGHTYEFLVSATKCTGTAADYGGGETALTVTTNSCALPAPAMVFATHITPNSIRIEWTHVPMAISYRIVYRDLTAGTPPITVFRSEPTHFFVANQLIPGHLYRFEVSASKCDGQYGPPKMMQAATTSIIIEDIIWENCCPIESDSIIKNGGAKDTLRMTPASGEGYHIKTVWFSNSTRYYDFCLHVDANRQLIVTPVDSSFAETTANSGALWTVKYDNLLLVQKPFFTISSLIWENGTGDLQLVVTYSVKSRVFKEFCPVVPRPPAVPDRYGKAETNGRAIAQPNPFRNVLQVQLPDNQENTAKIELFDLTGRAVLRRENCSGVVEIGTESMNSGVYFLKIAWPDGRLEVIKVLRAD